MRRFVSRINDACLPLILGMLMRLLEVCATARLRSGLKTMTTLVLGINVNDKQTVTWSRTGYRLLINGG